MVNAPNKPEDVWKQINIKGDADCWEWTGLLNDSGYGRMRVYYTEYRTHRIVYLITYGEIPKDKCVLHTCDNPKCCNPSHLYLGTPRDNANDMILRDRSASGERNGSHKLTQEDVTMIKDLYSIGQFCQWELGLMYGVKQTTVSDIVLGKRWNE